MSYLSISASKTISSMITNVKKSNMNKMCFIPMTSLRTFSASFFAPVLGSQPIKTIISLMATSFPILCRKRRKIRLPEILYIKKDFCILQCNRAMIILFANFSLTKIVPIREALLIYLRTALTVPSFSIVEICS